MNWTRYRTCSRVLSPPCDDCGMSKPFGYWVRRIPSSKKNEVLCLECKEERDHPGAREQKRLEAERAAAERRKAVEDIVAGRALGTIHENGAVSRKTAFGIEWLREELYDTEPFPPPEPTKSPDGREAPGLSTFQNFRPLGPGESPSPWTPGRIRRRRRDA